MLYFDEMEFDVDTSDLEFNLDTMDALNALEGFSYEY